MARASSSRSLPLSLPLPLLLELELELDDGDLGHGGLLGITIIGSEGACAWGYGCG